MSDWLLPPRLPACQRDAHLFCVAHDCSCTCHRVLDLKCERHLYEPVISTCIGCGVDLFDEITSFLDDFQGTPEGEPDEH